MEQEGMKKGKIMPITPEDKEFYGSHGIDTTPRYRGQEYNQGLIVPLKPFPDGEGGEEGYAVLKCGGTEVHLSFTLLHNLNIERPHKDNPFWSEIHATRKAFDAIRCEASEGHKG